MNLEHFPRFQPNGKADGDSVRKVAETLGLPRDYAEFLTMTDGGAGFIGGEYAVLVETAKLEEFNADYQVAELFPGIVLIGHNGGSEAIAFDQRREPRFILIPFLFEDDAIIDLGSSIEEVFRKLATEGYFGSP